ncbi:ABC transporter permease subunit [Clostridiaceae bacterium M8S5]|nr:ABC transporter permease subunit [Clostridiaceae bacterium M8S5]
MKRSKKSTLFSILFMGLGQIYNKEYLKGIVFAIVEIFAIFNINHFANALYGLVTLGTVPRQDHSLYLLVQGLIVVLELGIILLIYIFNIIDARNTAKERENGKEPLGTIEFIKYLWDKYFPHIMITPAFLFTVFFIFLPIIFTITVAFTNYSMPNHIPPRNLIDWVGLKNFMNIFKLKIWNNTLLHVGLWTICFAIVTTILNYSVGLFLALITNKKGIRFKKFWRTIFILPYAIPAFISLLVMRLAFSGPGPVNNLLVKIGLDKIQFFTDPLNAKIMVLLISVWLGSPYFMVLMSGVLTNIPKSLYEAARIDGASKWQQFKEITLPMVLFQTMPLLIMSFAFNFNNFANIYLLTDGNPVNSKFRYAGETDIIISWIYKMTKDQSQYHMASVVTIMLFIFVAGISAYSFIKTKSFKEEDMM